MGTKLSRLLRHSLLLSAVLLLGACRIEIIVPAGGTVQSLSGAYACAAGQTCTIDVYDTFFNQEFVAAADPGHRFAGWRKAQGSFCGGSQETCTLTSASMDSDPNLLAVLESDQVFYLEPIFEPAASAAGNGQAYRSALQFPRDFVEENWARGLRITSVSGNNGIWTVMMSRTEQFLGQGFIIEDRFPTGAISDAWSSGRWVTELAYNAGSWLAVTSSTGFGGQYLASSASFPSKEIDQYWGQGYHISDIAYGDGSWYVVMSRVAGFSTQTYTTSADYPGQWITSNWDAGFNITELTYGDGRWVVVMTKTNSLARQGWATRDSFPDQAFEEAWLGGWQILDMVYGQGRYALVFNTELETLMGVGF